jgi:hypothetical protein
VTMAEIPKIVMQCPKCGKQFPFDQVYCEECSAMLEPVETLQGASATPTEGEKGVPVKPPVVNTEKIEDGKIDSLRADIENKFVYTLLLEIEQLKRRLAKKEKFLSETEEKEGSPEYPGLVAAAGEMEAANEELLKKITKLEMTLDNLELTLKADITSLGKEIGKLERPGLFGLLHKRGRYRRMLASELNTKKTILDVIQGKRARSSLRTMSMLKPVLLVPAAALIFASAFFVYTYLHDVSPDQAAVSQAKIPDNSRAAVNEQDVAGLLEDIRTANLTKDLALWKSRYSTGYLALREQNENISDQWERVDYKSLSYTVEDLRANPSGATATIKWEIEFSPRKSEVVKRITQRLRADFVIEGGRLKIAAVHKQES